MRLGGAITHTTYITLGGLTCTIQLLGDYNNNLNLLRVVKDTTGIFSIALLQLLLSRDLVMSLNTSSNRVLFPVVAYYFTLKNVHVVFLNNNLKKQIADLYGFRLFVYFDVICSYSVK